MESCFSASSVGELFSKPRTKIEQTRVVFIAVDPSGSNYDKNSNTFCIVGMTSDSKIVCIDGFPAVRTIDYGYDLVDILAQLRDMDELKNSTFVVSAEAGTGFCAMDVEEIIAMNFDNVVFMSDHEKKPGMFMSKKVRTEMKDLTRNALDNGNLSIAEEITTMHKEVPFLEMLEKQLSEKTGNLAMMVQRAVWMKYVFFNDPKYSKYH